MTCFPLFSIAMLLKGVLSIGRCRASRPKSSVFACKWNTNSLFILNYCVHSSLCSEINIYDFVKSISVRSAYPFSSSGSHVLHQIPNFQFEEYSFFPFLFSPFRHKTVCNNTSVYVSFFFFREKNLSPFASTASVFVDFGSDVHVGCWFRGKFTHTFSRSI